MSSIIQPFFVNGDHKLHLITAASLGDLSLVENILRHNMADVDEVNSAGWTPLMYASHYGHYNVIRSLIRYKCSVDFHDQTQGRTALMLAASNGHSRSIEALLNYGKADKHIQDFSGNEAIHYANTCGHGNNKLIKALLGRAQELRGRSNSTPVMPSTAKTRSTHFSTTTTNLNCIESNEQSINSSNGQSIYNELSILSKKVQDLEQKVKYLELKQN